ncbi:choice-of-anchor A family protein [Baaleninema simplex]|uniref:choice-of-anchor A family protein n=1 Tax=Baaleninema simplex TaxID=2862350 RepID=UPI0003459B5A|nr:choice-of-anchor A family protein [Baaleninema simplex]
MLFSFDTAKTILSHSLPIFGSATVLAVTGLAQEANAFQLHNGLGFNAIVFNDLLAESGDTEGRLAVGGNLKLPGSYSVGDCSSGTIICSKPGNVLERSIDGSRIDLVVGGDITGSAAWGMNSGSARIGGNISGVDITTVPGSPNTIVDGLGNNLPVDFADLKADLRRDAHLLSTLDTTDGTAVTATPWSLVLKGTNSDLNVFNIDADTWAGSTGLTRYIDVPDGAKVIVNVAGERVDISGGQLNFGSEGCLDPAFAGIPGVKICGDPEDFSTRMLVNYYEAKTINLSAFDHQGSLLAPTANLSVSGGSVNGQSIVESAQARSGFEFHYRGNGGEVLDVSEMFPEDGGDNGDVTEIPEPSLLLGLLGVALMGVRRKRS